MAVLRSRMAFLPSLRFLQRRNQIPAEVLPPN
jgi:hypothetical protein